MGDFCYAPRPFYIKGGSSVTVRNNVFVSNNNSWEAFGFANHKSGVDEVLSRYNVIQNNVFVSSAATSIYVYNDGTAEATDVSFKTCTLSGNKYYMPADKYLYNAVSSTQYMWGDKNVFWATTGNEITSSKINSVLIQNPI
jgi:hypothetical protein